MQTSVSGNAGTATKLASAVTINNVPFDGSAGITINAVDSTARIATSEKGAANGVTPLGSDGKVPASYLPSYVDDVLEFSATGNFPASGETGKIYVATGTNKTYRWSGSGYVEISASPGSTDAVPEGAANLYFTTARAAAAAPVKTVAGKSGDVTLSKADVGLGSVDNTADSAKAVASAAKLTAARTINLTGGVTGSVTTDLSGAVSINATVTQDANNRFVTDAEKATWNGKATVGSVTPSAPGTAAVGTSGQAARADHVHPAQTSVSGNAGTASKLATARTISLTGGATGSMSFDGSANASIAVTVDASKHSHPFPFHVLIDPGLGLEVDASHVGYSSSGWDPDDLRYAVGALNTYDAGCRPNGIGVTGLVPVLVDMQMGIGRLDDLQTSDTTSLVRAINELKAALAGGGGGGVPPGTMMMYAGATFIPSGWLECDGSYVEQGDYPDLFNAIYDVWGPLDGTAFKLPDMRGLLAIGAGERPQDGYGVDWRQYGHVSTGDYTTQTKWTSNMISFPVEDSSVTAIGMKYIIKT
ncbi:phage tail protein [Azospirillum brasilense]|nr:phage tail protein [Azospirillum brasilense]